MQRKRPEVNLSGANEKGSNFSERASFALRSLISPVDKSLHSYDMHDAKHDRSYSNSNHFLTEPDSPSRNFPSSPKKSNTYAQPQFNIKNPVSTGMFNAEFISGENRNNNLSIDYRGSPRSLHQAQLNNVKPRNNQYENPSTLAMLNSPLSNNKSIAYPEQSRARAQTLSTNNTENSSIASSHLLQKNGLEILKPEIAGIRNDHLSIPNLQKMQSHPEAHSGSLSPARSAIFNNIEPPKLTTLKSMPSQVGNEIQLLKFTIKPPPPVEPDPFENKRLELAQPLTKLYSLVKNSPQKPVEAKIDYVALSVNASKNECALKKAKSLKNVMYRESLRDPSLRYKPKFKHRLGILLWFIVYPYFLKKIADKITKAKHSKINYKARQAVKEQVNHIAKFIKERCLKTLESIYSETKPLNFIGKKDKIPKVAKELPAKKLEKAKAVSGILISILQGLVIETSNEDLPEPLLEYLASISEDGYKIPSGLLFEFELDRLEFTQFMALRNMTPTRSKMVIGMFFIVRMLIFYFVTQPWAAKVKIKETPLLVENMQICSSILYHVAMDYFREKVPILPGNMDSLPQDKRVVPRDGPLVAFGDQSKELTEPEQDDAIVGLYSKQVLGSYFVSQTHAVLKMKSLLEEWLEEMYSRVHIIHIEGASNKRE